MSKIKLYGNNVGKRFVLVSATLLGTGLVVASSLKQENKTAISDAAAYYKNADGTVVSIDPALYAEHKLLPTDSVFAYKDSAGNLIRVELNEDTDLNKLSK